MKFSIRIITVTLLLTLIFFSSSMQAQELNDEQKKETIDNISQLLIDRYVFPEVGKRCASHIKAKLEDGSFNKVSDKKEFANLLTEELQSVSKDKHMRVRIQRGVMNESGSSNPYFEQYKNLKENDERNYAFRKVEILDGGIGYVDLRGFAQSDKAYDVAVLAMKFISNSNAVIFDLRRNGGGSPEMIRFILSYFFEKATHLNSLYWREGDRTVEYWTYEKVDGKKMSHVPMFVLTSNYTFSGGEEFTYNIKTQKRGVIIGEVTGGGANPGGMFPAGNGLTVFVPTGKAINPITNTNWEGVGVKPDIETSADDALDKAIELATVEAEKYKQKCLIDVSADFDGLLKNLTDAEELFNKNSSDAENKVNSSLNKLLKKNLIGEVEINMLGYQFLGEQKDRMAISIFKFNTEKYPESSNVWDSLAEAFMNNGENNLAIKNYKKSIKLNPDNENAKTMIRRMQNGE